MPEVKMPVLWGINNKDNKVNDRIATIPDLPTGCEDIFDNDLGPTPDRPAPDQDIRNVSVFHDHQNAYLYFRRVVNGLKTNTFYYFLDVNADGFMGLGEPVVYASFASNSLSALNMGMYVPDYNNEFYPGRGNPLMSASTPYQDPDAPVFMYQGMVDGHPKTGKVIPLFSSRYPPGKLRKNEIFGAALTEGGYGVKLSIPWRYLKNWLFNNAFVFRPNSKALKDGQVFFYQLSLQKGKGLYDGRKVVDNAGHCCGGAGRSAEANFDKTLEVEATGERSFRFFLDYENLTNAREIFAMPYFEINVATEDGQGVETNRMKMTVSADYNCNGVVDGVEKPADYFDRMATGFSEAFTAFPVDETGEEPTTVARAYQKACFIIDIEFPEGPKYISAEATFLISAFFALPLEGCESSGGRGINPIGVASKKVDLKSANRVAPNILSIDSIQNKVQDRLLISPNPSSGFINIRIPSNGQLAQINITDNLGRTLKKMSTRQSQLTINGLQPGVYMVQVVIPGQGKRWINKIIVRH